MSNNVNQGTQYRKKYIKLVNTLDFNLPFSYDNPKTKVSEKANRIITEDVNGTELKTFLTTGTGFNPIGQSSVRGFCGSFDGNGKEIKNLYINRPEEDNVALIGYISTGDNGEIKKIGITGNIIGNNRVGGIVGNNSTTGVTYCYNKANIEGKGCVGGINGISFAEVENCYNFGNVKVVAESNNSGNDAVGGIMGNAQISTKIRKCYNTGKIILENGVAMGGIVGSCNSIIIENCVNFGDFEKNRTSKLSYLGGILGWPSRGSKVKIENCYNKGKVVYENVSSVGGISGGNEVEIINSHYLIGTASGAVKGVDLPGQAEPKEESEMPSVLEVIQNQIEVDGKMINVFKEDTNNINNGYPILYWQ